MKKRFKLQMIIGGANYYEYFSTFKQASEYSKKEEKHLKEDGINYRFNGIFDLEEMQKEGYYNSSPYEFLG